MRSILLYCMCLMMAMPIMAKKKTEAPYKLDDYSRRMERFIIKESGFTDEETGKFFPIYHEMKSRQMKIGQQMMEMKKDKCPDRMSEKECADVVEKVASLKAEQAKIEEIYTKKLCKAISSRKVFKAINAEDRFHHMMFHDSWKRKGRW